MIVVLARIPIQARLLQEAVELRRDLVVVHVGERNMRSALERRNVTELHNLGVATVLVDEFGAKARLDDVWISFWPVVAPHELDLLELGQLLEVFERNHGGSEGASWTVGIGVWPS